MNLCGHHDMRTARACPNNCWRCIPCCHDRCSAPSAPKPKRERPSVARETRTTVAECGTRPGYAKHIRNHETACDECKEANNRYARDMRRSAA